MKHSIHFWVYCLPHLQTTSDGSNVETLLTSVGERKYGIPFQLFGASAHWTVLCSHLQTFHWLQQCHWRPQLKAVCRMLSSPVGAALQHLPRIKNWAAEARITNKMKIKYKCSYNTDTLCCINALPQGFHEVSPMASGTLYMLITSQTVFLPSSSL